MTGDSGVINASGTRVVKATGIGTIVVEPGYNGWHVRGVVVIRGGHVDRSTVAEWGLPTLFLKPRPTALISFFLAVIAVATLAETMESIPT